MTTEADPGIEVGGTTHTSLDIPEEAVQAVRGRRQIREEQNAILTPTSRLRDDLQAAAPAIRKQERERVQRSLLRVLDCCQEVAHEIEDPTQACAEIEQIARAALEDSDGE